LFHRAIETDTSYSGLVHLMTLFYKPLSVSLHFFPKLKNTWRKENMENDDKNGNDEDGGNWCLF